jgi:hypothetical protein
VNDAKRKYRLPEEVNALIDEALTFVHQDCGHRDQDGYGCIRCAAENADMLRRSKDKAPESKLKQFLPGKCAECGMRHRIACHWGKDIPEAGLVAHEFKPREGEAKR